MRRPRSLPERLVALIRSRTEGDPLVSSRTEGDPLVSSRTEGDPLVIYPEA
jgi:hypothetical protein